jgi:hypothetical protein
MSTTLLTSPALHQDVLLYERVMVELLDAARISGRAQLSPPAQAAVVQLGPAPETDGLGWPAQYGKAARALRERLIRLGLPRSRYLSGEWINRGL